MDGLREWRTRHGYTQAQLAEMIPVRSENLCRWERGHHKASRLAVQRLGQLIEDCAERGCPGCQELLATRHANAAAM